MVGTVRTEKKGEELAKLYTKYDGLFSFAVVPDIAKVSYHNLSKSLLTKLALSLEHSTK